MRPQRRLLAATVLLATAFAGTPALLSSADAAPGTSDRSVARAADRYGVSEKGLQQRLRNDPNFRITPSGAAYIIEPAATIKSKPTHLVAQTFPLPDTFLLHSKPGSQRTIYLDFDGHNVTNTAWNGPAGGNVPNGSHPAMDLGNNGAAFSDAEKFQIQDIYQRVAEDYAPFDVDVTTQEPTAAALDRTNAGDLTYGVRAVISPSVSAATAICNNQCGGVAFIGVFNHFAGNGGDPTTHEQYQPAWVFPQHLGSDPKNIAEATTHEVGHNLGLDHDSFNGQNNYYGGHDSWAPIMGGAYDRPISQFSQGGYPNASLGASQSNPDDLVTIGNFLSPAANDLRTDEPGNSIGSAGAVPAAGVSAYITSRTDVDFFALGTCSGNVTVAANGAEVSPNLDIEVQLLNAGGTVIASDNPSSAFVNRDNASGMDAAATGTSLASGQYYARIDGVGRGTPLAAYDDYGSIGAYTLSVSGCGGVVAAPPSVPLSLTGAYLGSGDVELSWAPPADDGGAPVTSYQVYMDGVLLGSVPTAVDNGALVDNVPSGVHDFGVAAVNSIGPGPQAHVSVNATDVPQAVPGKPRIGNATPGKRGGKLTAKIAWQPPAASANPAINGYQVIAYRENNKGKFVKFSTSPVLGAGARSIVFTTNTRARLKFAVKARNSIGFGALSSKSNAVRPR